MGKNCPFVSALDFKDTNSQFKAEINTPKLDYNKVKHDEMVLSFDRRDIRKHQFTNPA
jgi:hypothetical protein